MAYLIVDLCVYRAKFSVFTTNFDPYFYFWFKIVITANNKTTIFVIYGFKYKQNLDWYS
jgi:hypothetical protein